MHRQKIVIVTVILIVFLFIVGGAVFSYFLRSIYIPISKDTSQIEFVITKGEGVNKISGNLKEEDLIRNRFIFETYVYLLGAGAKFQAGEYDLSQNTSMKEIVRVLTRGEIASRERTIKIIEGWRAQEIGEYLEKEGIISQKEFLAEIRNPKLEIRNYLFLKDLPKGASLEGFLFPDTYRIYKDAGVENIIGKMLDNFDKKLTFQMRGDIASQGRTIFEVVTLASIIEKEVSKDEDRYLVADIFLRRLKSGKHLESCATINYILGIHKRQYSFEDTRVASPYNTYINKGLPLGPISNPGLSAIKAAIYPKENDYWYFLSKEDGETVFSYTIEEHNRNKAKYLR